MKISTETLMIHAVLNDHEYWRKAGQFLKPEHFEEQETRAIYTLVEDYVSKYSEKPSLTEIIGMASGLAINPETQATIEEIIKFEPDDEISTDWILDTSEEYCRRRAMKLALMESYEIIDGKDKKNRPLSSVSDIMDKAVNFKFDPDIGLNFYDDISRKMDSYNESVSKIALKLGMLNKITNGGIERKTVNMVAAPTGFGKTIWMADEAVHQSRQGYNVVYVTFEMSDDRISKRMDATAQDLTLDDLRRMSEESLREKFEGLRNKKHGYLILKEFPPGEVTAAKLRLYLKEVEMTMGEPVDILVVDYINLMASSRFRSDQTYLLLKGVCEELVALAKKLNIAIISATQFNRGGQKNSSPEISDVAESQAVANTVDFLLALFDTEELSVKGRAVGKQLKNRYGDKNYMSTFILGIERAKMKFFDVSEDESTGLADNIETPAAMDINRAPKFSKDGKTDSANSIFEEFNFN